MTSRIYLAFFGLLIILGLQGVNSAWKMGQTTDETYFTASGYAMVRFNSYDFLGEQPPLISQIASFPLLFLQPRFDIVNPIYLPDSKTTDISRNGARFLYQMGNNPHTILFLQRLPIVILSLLLGAAVFFLGKDLFGVKAGLFALAFYAFDPNIIAHGSLNTTDLGLATFYFLSICSLYYFFKRPHLKAAVIVGVLCGMTFLSKISGLIVFPVAMLLFLCFYFTNPLARQGEPIHPKSNLLIGILALFLLANSFGQKQPMVTLGPMCLLAVFLCFDNHKLLSVSRYAKLIFRGLLLAGLFLCFLFSVKLKKKYGIEASAVFLLWNTFSLIFSFFLIRVWKKNAALTLFVTFFLTIWLVAGLVIIFDYTDWIYKIHRFVGFGHYAQPLGIVLSHSQGGHKICVDGSFVTCDWRYFFTVASIKTPLLTLSLSLLGLLSLLFSKKSLLIKSLIIIPSGLFLCAAALNGINIGLRHILPVYPFLILLAGFFFSQVLDGTKGLARNLTATIMAILFLFSVGRVLLAAPDYLSYFNEFVRGPEHGAKLVADSNLNWGQDNARLAQFVIDKEISSIKIRSEAENADVYNYYRLNWSQASEKDLTQPSSGFYAIGIGIYASLQKNPNSWFMGKKPLYIVGKTFYVFQVDRSAL